MKFTYEKVSGGNEYQVRLKGEFVCYITKENNGWVYRDGDRFLWVHDRDSLMQAVMKRWGIESKEDLLIALMSTHLYES